MGRKKEKFKDIKASCKTVDTFGTVFESMCKSEAYKGLTIGAKHFYTLCRVQSRSKTGRSCLFKHQQVYGINYNPEIYFVFPAKQMEEYGEKRQNGHRYFKELEQAGFIEIAENNSHIKKVNVYKFSDKWKS